MILSGLSLWEKGSPLHKSTQQVRTQGPIRHADCRQRKLADFLCTGGIIQGRIRRLRRIRQWCPNATRFIRSGLHPLTNAPQQ
ncbi:hypothetical protein D2186_05560 [Escherichia coli]|nr:hypothetical protein D2186_05560 [Escherichia coli]